MHVLVQIITQKGLACPFDHVHFRNLAGAVRTRISRSHGDGDLLIQSAQSSFLIRLPPTRKGLIGLIRSFSPIVSEHVRGLKLRFLAFFPRVLEGLARSGRLVGTISTYPGT